MLFPVLCVAAYLFSLSDAQSVPGIFGPATGVCGPITITYGSSGSGSQLQTFVAPSPGAPYATSVACKPSVNDTYTYTLGPAGLPSYALKPALRQVGTNVSPALGYFDTPALNLKSVTPLAGAPPAPIPAGAYDVGLSYASQGNALCLNGSASARSVFVVQAPTASALSGPATTASNDQGFTLTVNVTYSTDAVQLPFSNPAAVANGTIQFTTSTSSPQPVGGTAKVAASGPGFVTYQMSPTQPLPVGNYTVVATYTPTAAFLFGSTSNAYTFLVGPAVTSPPPTSTAAPATSTLPPTTTTRATPPPTTTANATPPPTTTAKATNPPTITARTTTSPPKTTTKAPPPTTTKKPPTTPTPSPISRFCCRNGIAFCCREGR